MDDGSRKFNEILYIQHPTSSFQLPTKEDEVRKSKLKGNQTIQISGSKSISNRLLILERLFKNIKIGNLSNSQDTQLLKKLFQKIAILSTFITLEQRCVF